MPHDSANGSFRALRRGIGTPRECQVRAEDEGLQRVAINVYVPRGHGAAGLHSNPSIWHST